MELVKGEHVSAGEAEAGATPAAPWHPVTVPVGRGIGGVGEEIPLLTLTLVKQSAPPHPTTRAFQCAFSAPLLYFPIGNPPVWLFCLALVGLIGTSSAPPTPPPTFRHYVPELMGLIQLDLPPPPQCVRGSVYSSTHGVNMSLLPTSPCLLPPSSTQAGGWRAAPHALGGARCLYPAVEGQPESQVGAPSPAPHTPVHAGLRCMAGQTRLPPHPPTPGFPGKICPAHSPSA
ncbi:transcription initiation factor IIB [Platysternon megacephalum]|uniref:Transcription initiation factor IIB n=1 Tax=Platysternon megacephalum TaxID=55544 RepID=A0A4D9EL30_9SAUR|nr:transcription initiation factor IIB [Platysternon megacephalum]